MAIAAPSYGLLTDLDELREIVSRILEQGRPFAFDIETGYDGESREKAGLHPEENFVTGISLTNSLKWARYIPLRHDAGTNCDNTTVAEILWPLFTTQEPLGVAHGAVFELRCMSRWFEQYINGGYFRVRSCTLLESYAEGENKKHGLKEITEANFGHVMTELDELFEGKLTRKQKECKRFNVLDQHDPAVISYACEDSVWCLAHHRRRYPLVKDSFIYKLEMAVLEECTCEIADNGILYDWNMMREGAARAAAFAEQYKQEVFTGFAKITGHPVTINLNSPPQLSKLLYEDCEMPVVHWTKGGKSKVRKPSTDGRVALPLLAKKYPAVKLLRNYRGIEKLRGTYLEVYPQRFSYAPDGRTHPGLIQHGAISGRTSADGPPYQQSPKFYHYELSDGTVFEFNFRDCIVAPDGYYILGFDLAQAELRVIAGLAGETQMFEAFERGEDVHQLTASLIFGKRREDVTPEERDVGKTMGLALVYGLTPQGLSDRLGITVEQAEDLFIQFHAAYPKIKEWTENTIRQSKYDGYVTTWFGRKVRIWEYESPYPNVRREGERTAGNAPVQGSATGDYVKASMVRGQRALKKAGLHPRVQLFMNVHDALYWYVPKDIQPWDVIKVLDPAVAWQVDGWPPMVAEWGIGLRWGSMKKLEILPGGGLRAVSKEKPKTELTGDEDETAQLDVDVASVKKVLSGGSGGTGGDAGQVAVPGPVPEDGAGLVRPAVLPVHASGCDTPRTVVIGLAEMPETNAAQALADALRMLPGQNTVILRTPGRDVRLSFACGLTPEHEPEVSVILGGAQVHYDAASVDQAALTAGLAL